MRRSIEVQMTTTLMLTHLGTYPIFEQTKENKQDAIDLCHKVLDLAMDINDESKYIGTIAVVYIVAEVMELTEILDTPIIVDLLRPRNGKSIRLKPEETYLIGELATEDYEGYIAWISQFLSEAGVDDIQSELEDLDAIQDAIQELPQ